MQKVAAETFHQLLQAPNILAFCRGGALMAAPAFFGLRLIDLSLS